MAARKSPPVGPPDTRAAARRSCLARILPRARSALLDRAGSSRCTSRRRRRKSRRRNPAFHQSTNGRPAMREVPLSTSRPCVARKMRGKNRSSKSARKMPKIQDGQKSNRRVFLEQPLGTPKDPPLVLKQSDRRRSAGPRSKVEERHAKKEKPQKVGEEQPQCNGSQPAQAAQTKLKTFAGFRQRAGRRRQAKTALGSGRKTANQSTIVGTTMA